MKACYTAIFGNYDDLKEPTIVSPGWEYICFTDQPLKSDIWQIRQVEAHDPQWKAREVKIMSHHYLTNNETMWLDASFHIRTDLNKFWAMRFKSPFTAPRHPLRHCVYSEIRSCIANGRGDVNQLLAQEQEYKKLGIRINEDNIISSGILMRDQRANKLNEAWWQEMQGRSVRDQVAFAKICRNFEWYKTNFDYSQSSELKYIRHIHLRH